MSMSFVLFVPFVAIPLSIFRLFVQSYRACFDIITGYAYVDSVHESFQAL